MSSPTANARPSLARRIYVALAAVFVVWHLFAMVVSNCKIQATWIDASVKRYENLLYVDQAWGMFVSPLWKHTPFLGARVHLSDGSTAEILSENEPANITHFFRWGGFRHRKLEHLVSQGTKGKVTEPIGERYAAYFAQRWRAMHPDDPRHVERVTLIERDYAIPAPGESWDANPKPTVKDVATYEMKGE